MSELPFLARLAIAICPNVKINVAKGETRIVPMAKVFNVGRDKIASQARKELRRRQDRA